MIHNFILNLCTRARYHILFFAPPSHKISSNKCAISSGRFSIPVVTNITRIRVSLNVYMSVFPVQQTFSRRTFNISQNLQCNYPMNFSRLLHESTQYPNGKGYMWPSNREIDQFFNQCSVPSWIIKSVGIIKLQVYIGFHWSTSRFAPQKSCLVPKIHSILLLKENHTMFWCATSIPRKYLGSPMSLITKWRLRFFCFQ